MSEANEVDGIMFRGTEYFPIIYQQVSGTTRVIIAGLMATPSTSLTAFAQWLPPILVCVRSVAATYSCSLSSCDTSPYSFVFWSNKATDLFSTLLAFTSKYQSFTIHFCRFEKDCYRTETSAADNIIEDLLPGPFGYFLPPASGLWRKFIFGLNLSYHILFSFNLSINK